MTDQESDLKPVIEGSEYPPLLNLVVPALILLTSVAYAWSLRDVDNPGMNLLLLKPLFVAIWVLLLAVFFEDVIPSIRQSMQSRASAAAGRPWSLHFAPGTEAGASLVVAATFLYSFFGPGGGPAIYLASTFLYLAVVGYLIGDRQPFRLIVQAAVLAGMLYLIMGVLLGVRL